MPIRGHKYYIAAELGQEWEHFPSQLEGLEFRFVFTHLEMVDSGMIDCDFPVIDPTGRKQLQAVNLNFMSLTFRVKASEAGVVIRSPVSPDNQDPQASTSWLRGLRRSSQLDAFAFRVGGRSGDR
jgi:hypothetical protein